MSRFRHLVAIILVSVVNTIQVYAKEDSDSHLLIATSLHKTSLNRQLIVFVGQVLREHNIKFATVSIAEYLLPAFNQDIVDKKIPEKAMELCNRISSSKAVIIASPEYNSSMPGFFKNTIDWMSAILPNSCFKNKPVYLMSVSSTNPDGFFGLIDLERILNSQEAYTYPRKFTASNASNKKQNRLNLNLKTQQKLIKQLREFDKYASQVQLLNK